MNCHPAFYLRLQAVDQPGVFRRLATAFGDARVSLDMILQKRSVGGMAEIAWYSCVEEIFYLAETIKSSSVIKKINSVLRVIEIT